MINLDKKTESGIKYAVIKDLHDTEYHAEKGFWGQSMLKSNLSNSKKFKYEILDGNFKVTPTMEFGTNFHCFLLQNDLFRKEYFIYDESKRTHPDKDFRNPDNKKWKAEQVEEAESENKIILPMSDLKHFEGMRDSMFAWRKNGYNPIKMFIESCESEVSYFVEDFNGIPVKIRIDILLEKLNIAGDLKVTSDCSFAGFKSKIKHFGYDFQSAFYSDIHYLVTEKQLDNFFILAVEPTPPYNFNPISMNNWIEAGRLGYTLATEKAKVKLTEYNGYVDNIEGKGYFNKIKCSEFDKERYLN